MTKIVGTGGGDTLRGTDETDRIWGLAGNDELGHGSRHYTAVALASWSKPQRFL